MDLNALSELVLDDPDGASHRLGDLWADKPVILVFLRHFGWLHCRYHAAQLRRSYEEIKAKGVELVAIGTGDARYARAFIDEENIPFPVLLDEDGEAAEAASVKKGRVIDLVGPKTVAGALKATADGHRQHKNGRRSKQLGATFVIGPGDVVHYEHLDGDVSDHAPVEEVLEALG